MKIILASGSPRRKELLSMFVPNFEIMVSNADESLIDNLTPEEQVTRLAYLKAKSVYDSLDWDRIVIGSDTMVYKNNKLFGKPKSKEHAKEMLKELLSGDKSHYVVTGLSVLIKDGDIEKEFKTYDKSKVYFTDITDEEIDKWIDSGKAMDKAGAYAIQDEFGVFLDKIEGNYSTVVGLPIHKLYEIIKDYID